MTLEPKSKFTYPPFVEAVASFRRFLGDQGLSNAIRWLWREDICTRRAPGSRQTWNRSVYVNLSRTSDASLVERYYHYGVGRDLGLALEVFCVAAGHSCCFVYVPEDETDASYRMLAGLKLTVPTSPTMGRGIRNPLVWAVLRFFIGRSDDYWIHDVPRRIDAVRVAG